MSKKNNAAKPAAEVVAPPPTVDTIVDAPSALGEGATPDATQAAAVAVDGADAVGGDGGLLSEQAINPAPEGETVPGDGDGDGDGDGADADEGGQVARDLAPPPDELVRVKLLCSNHLGLIGEVVPVPWHHVADLESAGLVDSHPASVEED